MSDGLTEFFRQALVILGSRHKERLGTGIALGFFIQFVYFNCVALELLPKIDTIVSSFGCIAFGVLVVFIPVWADPKKLYIGEQEQNILALVDELSERGGLTATQKKLAYKIMLDRLVDSYDPSTQVNLQLEARAAVTEAALDKRQEL